MRKFISRFCILVRCVGSRGWGEFGPPRSIKHGVWSWGGISRIYSIWKKESRSTSPSGRENCKNDRIGLSNGCGGGGGSRPKASRGDAKWRDQGRSIARSERGGDIEGQEKGLKKEKSNESQTVRLFGDMKREMRRNLMMGNIGIYG